MEESSPTPKIGKDDVIAKLKDDGDFDNLRLKIIRKLKDNVTKFSLSEGFSLLFIFYLLNKTFAFVLVK